MPALQLGNLIEDSTVHFMWDSNDSDGASITLATDGTISVYKDDNLTEITAGVTFTEDLSADAIVGVHRVDLVLTDAAYITGSDYSVVLSGATIDGQTVNAVLAYFSIENRFNEVDAVKISGDVTAADNLESMLDGIGAVLTLSQLRINSAAAGGAVDIDNSGGLGVAIDSSTTDGVVIGAGGGGDGVAMSGHGAGAGLYIVGGPTGEGLRIMKGLFIDTIDVASTTALWGAATMPAGLAANITGNLSGSVGSVTARVTADVTYIHGSALTGTSGQLAAAFVKLFDVATPTGTINSLPDAIPDAAGGLPTTTKITDARLGVLTDWIDGGRLDLLLDDIPSTGAGSTSETINIKVSGNPIDGAEVRITSDAAGNATVAGPQYTDAFGNVTFRLDPGTYYAWISASGYDFTNPTTITVT